MSDLDQGKDREFHKYSVEELYQLLETSSQGLDDREALLRQEKYGGNLLAEPKKKSMLVVFLSNFIHLMALLLWVSGAIAFIADMPQLGLAIWLVNIINGIFSFSQERKADEATEALKNMLPAHVRVIRNGQEEKILAEDLVIGDLILLQEGDKISADARLVETSDLQVEQSALTGESNPIRKSQDPILILGLTKAEMNNLIFAGTSVSEGNGKAVVTATGMDTEFGKIAYLTQNLEEEDSPLELELNRLTKQISLISISIGTIFFLLSVFFVKESLVASFIFALGMIVAFIPEGLLPTVTLSLARAVERMSKKNALVKKLSSVETLGSTSVICTDKTGTLTQNEMTVSNLWTLDREYKVTGVGYESVGKVLDGDREVNGEDDKKLGLLLSGAALCSNAKLLPREEGKGFTVLGDPTEACLRVVAEKADLDMDLVSKKYPRIKELPFESRRKRMTTIHRLRSEEGESRIAFTKGAPKEIGEICKTYLKGDQELPMDQETFERIMEANDSYARNGLRVLALAYRDLSGDSYPGLSEYKVENVERDLVFVGLVVMADPPRPEVKEAVERCRAAGIRVVMITGDYGLTAESIAKRIGIVKKDNPKLISGLELE